jgi:hypothetical protein
MRLSAKEGPPDSKYAYAKQKLEEIQGKEWKTPEEFNALFPKFDSDVRMSIPILIQKDTDSKGNSFNTMDSRRVNGMANIINYLGTVDDPPLQGSITKLLEKLFKDSTGAQKLSYVIDIIDIWVKLAGRAAKLKETLLREFDEQEVKDVINKITPQTSNEALMSAMLKCRYKINQEDSDSVNMSRTTKQEREDANKAYFNNSKDYEYLESALLLLIQIRSKDFEKDNQDVEGAWVTVTDKWRQKSEDQAKEESKKRGKVVQPYIREEWVEMPEEYTWDTWSIIKTSFERPNRERIMIFILLVKLYGK